MFWLIEIINNIIREQVKKNKKQENIFLNIIKLWLILKTLRTLTWKTQMAYPKIDETAKNNIILMKSYFWNI